jgi:hypothetical protein
MFKVLVAVCLLCFASPTLAESAWMLWAQDNRYENAIPGTGTWGTQTSRWDIIEGFADEGTCKQHRGLTMLEVLMNVQSDKEDVLYKRTDNKLFFSFFPKNAKPTDRTKYEQILIYVCLPDTIDPRIPNR